MINKFFTKKNGVDIIIRRRYEDGENMRKEKI